MAFERIDGETPSGGNYLEAEYLDSNMRPCDKESAVQAIVREFKEDGTLIKTTYGTFG